MDFKTMEYMGQRVDEGRRITREIKDLKERVNELQARDFRSVAFTTNTGSDIRLYENKEVTADIRDAAVVILLDRIDILKSVFDKL